MILLPVTSAAALPCSAMEGQHGRGCRLLAPSISKSAAGALMEHFHLESWGSSLWTEQLNFTRGPEETLNGMLIPQVERCGCEGTLPSCLTRSRQSMGKSPKAKSTLLGWFAKTCHKLGALHCRVFSSLSSPLGDYSGVHTLDYLQFLYFFHPLYWLLPPYLLYPLLFHSQFTSALATS